MLSIKYVSGKFMLFMDFKIFLGDMGYEFLPIYITTKEMENTRNLQESTMTSYENIIR